MPSPIPDTLLACCLALQLWEEDDAWASLATPTCLALLPLATPLATMLS
jgi:hypothetical protein